LRNRGLGCVIETGARFLLDPRQKHEPTLVSSDPDGRARRIEFLTRALEAASETNAEAMSFWAGVPKPEVSKEQARDWVIEGAMEIVSRAERLGTIAALEPEPGMAVETVADWEALAIPGLRLALDTGHCLVTGDIEPASAVRDYAENLGTVTIEDMKRGAHVHLPFGEGDMDIAGVLGALSDISFTGLVCVELSRESHRADTMVPGSLSKLKDALSL
jgi:sugar phosphate isomerase/epimerase